MFAGDLEGWGFHVSSCDEMFPGLARPGAGTAESRRRVFCCWSCQASALHIGTCSHWKLEAEPWESNFDITWAMSNFFGWSDEGFF